MDAGLAAVCGALAGTFATIGAAFAAGRTQLESARLAAHMEHHRQRREPRHGFYRAFIAAMEELQTAIGQRKPGPHALSDFTSAYVRECRDRASSVKAVWVDVALAGPENVSTLAEELAQSVDVISSLCADLGRIREDQERNPAGKLPQDTIALLISFEQTVQPMTENLPKFRKAARNALDDNGLSNLRTSSRRTRTRIRSTPLPPLVPDRDRTPVPDTQP
ncbi:hypothetical protein [Streptomyces sp. NPDC059743]|uniref:hypothetical protein n=1 Tax=Streptomyces sp. NPDC059743 TaxID=3346928 RepID=UPI00364AFDA3